MRLKLASITQTMRLPSICVLCNQANPSPLAVCSECISLLPQLGPSCTHCANPLPDAFYPICGACIKKKPHFDLAAIAYSFEEPIRTLLHRFKYQNGLYLGPFLGQLIFNAKEQKKLPTPECLIPVPLHASKIKHRGFNQTLILTQFLAKRLHIPYDVKHCRKITNTLAQAHLDKIKRSGNIKKAFVVDKLPYRHIALVDDLLTTGSTLNELAKQLKKAGVCQVDIWCCARTIGK